MVKETAVMCVIYLEGHLSTNAVYDKLTEKMQGDETFQVIEITLEESDSD
jgi:hypothetical protein